MPFNYLLTNLLVDVPTAVGAIFLDEEGETIECVTRHADPYEMKVEGAYHSIFKRRFETALRTAATRGLSRYTMTFDRLATLTEILPGGYYVVLVMDREGSEALARRHLQKAARIIARELA
ncbi:MAG TPA: hypothetical protein ENK19_01990 [Acidobacteria bacterium]|nr:hypothetical protein [Acidobacteriota bacterium]